jgi:hypothetical protein
LSHDSLKSTAFGNMPGKHMTISQCCFKVNSTEHWYTPSTMEMRMCQHQWHRSLHHQQKVTRSYFQILLVCIWQCVTQMPLHRTLLLQDAAHKAWRIPVCTVDRIYKGSQNHGGTVATFLKFVFSLKLGSQFHTHTMLYMMVTFPSQPTITCLTHY